MLYIIKNIDDNESSLKSRAYLEESDKPDYKSLTTFLGNESFVQPVDVNYNTIMWLWAAFHNNKSKKHIRENLFFAIERGMYFCTNMMYKPFCDTRNLHDCFFIALAILADDEKILNDVAKVVIEADPLVDEYQFVEAITGILKNMVLGNNEKVVEQFNILNKFNSTSDLKQFYFPSKSTIEAFINQNGKNINKKLKENYRKFFKLAEKQNAIVDNSVLDISRLDTYHLWPWLEACFIKLLNKKDCLFDIKYDSFWLPRGMFDIE